MKRQNNKISDGQRYLDINLTVNPIETGNTPAGNINQGSIYTSELKDGYVNSYEGIVISITSEKIRTGSKNFFIFNVRYIVNSLLPNGWFGNNLINEGEPFTVLNSSSGINFNYVKGFIVKIVSKTENTVMGADTYTYSLMCSITDGDISNLLYGGGQIFKTNRRLFLEETKYKPPINLYSTINEVNNKTLLFWQDTTDLAVGYQVRIRSSNLVSYDVIHHARGNHAEFKGSVIPLMFNPPYGIAGQVTTLKFIDVGLGCSFNTIPLNFATSATPPVAALYTNECGSLLIKTCEIKEILSVGTNYVDINVKIKDGNTTYPITPNSYIDLPFLGRTENAYVYSILMLNNYYATIRVYFEKFSFTSVDIAKKELLNKKAAIHIVNITSLGSGLTKPPKIYYDKYPTNTKFVWPTVLVPGTYYFSVSTFYDCNKKTYSEWSPEEVIIVR